MYTVTEEKRRFEDGERTLYGIRCGEDLIAEDVTTDREKARRIADAFNRYGLSPEHFYDAIEDILAE